MKPSRQERARKMLIRMNIKSADDFAEKSLGRNHERNRKVVEAVIFKGWTLKKAGETFGISAEQARSIALKTVRRRVGRYEDVPTPDEADQPDFGM